MKLLKKIVTTLFCALAVASLAQSASAQGVTVLDYNASWKFNTNGLDLGTAWRSPGYNDSSWPTGAGAFATAGEALLQGATIGTTLRTSTGSRFITNFYFRTTFTLNSMPPNGFLLVTNQLDDGAVIYLNGNEVGRFAMGSGTISHTSFATRADDITSASHGVEVLRITNGWVIGQNTIAVEVHQANGTSSDAAFAQKIVVSAPGYIAEPPYTLLGLTNDTWRYNESGTDLGTAWRETNYNDSAWLTGRGVFAWDTAAAVVNARNTILNMTNSGGQRVNTFYFRNKFVLTNDPGTVSVRFTNMLDDGLVVYVNGQEAFRTNIGNGRVTFSTLAQAAWEPEGSLISYVVPPHLLVQGTNTVAAEIHQNSTTSSDIVFGLGAGVYFPDPTPLVITQDLQNVVFEEAKRVGVTLGLQGVPAYYRWYKATTNTYASGVAIANGTSNPLLFDPIRPADAGFYYVIVTNGINSVTSQIARVTILADTNSPTIVDADGTESLTNVIVSFSERVALIQATNRANYSITNTFDRTALSISAARLDATGTNVILHTAQRNEIHNYILSVSNVRDVSTASNSIVPNSMYPISRLVTIVPLLNASYDFYQPQYITQSGANQGTAWRSNNYTLPGYWQSGVAPFYLSIDGFDEVPFEPQTFLGESELITSYYRTFANANVSPSGARLFLQHYVVDGAVFYLNGAEVLRYNMGPTNDYTTPARAQDSGVMVDPVEIPVYSIRSGANLLAAEVHTSETFDTHIAYTAGLTAIARSLTIGPVIITGGPENKTVTEGSPVTFSVVSAGGMTFQWQRGSNNIAGATNATYTIDRVLLSDNNASFRVIVGATGQTSVTSSNAVLRVVADTNAPVLLAGYYNPNGSIRLEFSELIGTASGQATANYRVTNSAGLTYTVSSAAVTLSNVTLNFASLPTGLVTVVVNNVRDASTGGNLIASNSAVRVGFNSTVITMTGTWKYDQSGSEPAGWNTVGFNDSAWPSGPGLLDGKENGRNPADLPFPVGTVLLNPEAGPNLQYLYTTYFRTKFNAYGGSTATLTLETVMDDGAVIYLNGVEVTRVRMPNGTIAYSTQANASVGDGEFEGPDQFTVTNLVSGENVLAVEVHQNGTASSDVTWGANVQVFVPSTIIQPTNGPTNNCTPIALTKPTLNYERLSTNTFRLFWTNPITNGAPCNTRATFTLQQAFGLSNSPALTQWMTVTTNTSVTLTNTGTARYYRLRHP